MSRHISRVLLGVAMACLVTGASPALLASHALAQRAKKIADLVAMLERGETILPERSAGRSSR